MERVFLEIGLYGAKLPKVYTAFLVAVYSKVVTTKNCQCSLGQMLESKTIGKSFMTKLIVTNEI